MECRRLGGSAADHPDGVVHAQAAGAGCLVQVRQLVAQPWAREAFPRLLW